MGMYKLVREMHEKFGIAGGDTYTGVTDAEKSFRAAAIHEELVEYLQATSPPDQLDAIVDLVVFAIGLAERHGFSKFEEAFERVLKANMAKELGPNSKRGSYALDLVKPEGWKPANLADLVSHKVPGHG